MDRQVIRDPGKNATTWSSRTFLRLGLGVVLAIVASWLCVRNLRWTVLSATLVHADLALVGLALLTVLATTAAKAARWWVLLRACPADVGGGRAVRSLLIGQLGNIVLPIRLGDLARAALVGPETRGGMPAALGVLVAEKALDGVAGLSILIGLALWAPLPDWVRAPALLFAAVTAGLLLLLLVAAVQRRGWAVHGLDWLLRRLPRSAQSWFERLVSGFERGLGLVRDPHVVGLALVLTVLVWVLASLTNVATMAALGIKAPIWSALWVLVAVHIAVFLPTIPAQVGVFEYASALALTTAGVTAEAALAFGLLLHLLVYLPPLVLGPVSMVIEGVSWNRLARVGRADPELDVLPS